MLAGFFVPVLETCNANSEIKGTEKVTADFVDATPYSSSYRPKIAALQRTKTRRRREGQAVRQAGAVGSFALVGWIIPQETGPPSVIVPNAPEIVPTCSVENLDVPEDHDIVGECHEQEVAASGVVGAAGGCGAEAAFDHAYYGFDLPALAVF